MGIIKDSIVQTGGLKSAIAVLREQPIPRHVLDVLLEVEEGISEVKSRWARSRKHTARLPVDSLAAIEQGFDSGLPVAVIARNAKTSCATVYRHAQKRREKFRQRVG